MSPARPTTLVLCERSDQVGPWIERGLGARGFGVTLVTADELTMAATWEHRVAASGEASFEVRFADGRAISSAEVGGAVNRLIGVPDVALARADPPDREYAEQEWRALLASALASLVHAGVPVVEAPDPFLLSGRWRSPLEWSLLAAQAGLTVWPWTWTADDWLPRPEVGDGHAVAVLVVGREAFPSVPLDETTLGACRRLTALAGRWTLAVELAVDAAGETFFVNAGGLPDLATGGEAALDALAAILAA